MQHKALLSLFAVLMICSAAVAKSPIVTKIISYNIRTLARDGNNSWQYRKHATKNMLDKHKPDAFGLQEAKMAHLQYIDSACPQYARVGVGRDDGKTGGEIMAIYYNKERYDLIKSGTFWLSETPEKVSRGWDAACYRTTTWVQLRDKESRQKFFYFNTHLDHKGAEAQANSIKLILEQIKKIAGKKAPVILTGDFNITPESSKFTPLNEQMKSARTTAPITDHKGTYNAYGKIEKAPIIDFIFYRGKNVNCLKFHTLDGDYGAPYISDHYPIEATFYIK